MTAWEEIERARSQKLVDEDGNAVELVTSPPLREQEIAALAERVGNRSSRRARPAPSTLRWAGRCA
jgi:hypothetical protein